MSKKVLQLFRSNPIYPTKELARWITTANVDILHYGEEVEDGEPLIARFYKDASGSTYYYEKITTLTTVNVQRLKENNLNIPTVDSDPAEMTGLRWGSAPFVKYNSSFYILRRSDEDEQPQTNISSIFGLIYANTVTVAGVMVSYKLIIWSDIYGTTKKLNVEEDPSEGAVVVSTLQENGYTSNKKRKLVINNKTFTDEDPSEYSYFYYEYDYVQGKYIRVAQQVLGHTYTDKGSLSEALSEDPVTRYIRIKETIGNMTLDLYGYDIAIGDSEYAYSGLVSGSRVNPAELTEMTSKYMVYTENGVVYKWDEDAMGYKKFEINSDTNVAESTAILDYLTHYINLGRYDSQYYDS